MTWWGWILVGIVCSVIVVAVAAFYLREAWLTILDEWPFSKRYHTRRRK